MSVRAQPHDDVVDAGVRELRDGGILADRSRYSRKVPRQRLLLVDGAVVFDQLLEGGRCPWALRSCGSPRRVQGPCSARSVVPIRTVQSRGCAVRHRDAPRRLPSPTSEHGARICRRGPRLEDLKRIRNGRRCRRSTACVHRPSPRRQPRRCRTTQHRQRCEAYRLGTIACQVSRRARRRLRVRALAVKYSSRVPPCTCSARAIARRGRVVPGGIEPPLPT